MTAPLKIPNNETLILRAHREDVAHSALRILWRRAWLIVAIFITAVLLAVLALVLIEPRYTGEAMIRFNFNHDASAAGSRSQPIASLDAAVLIDSAARLIRSRTTASAVVERLGLDKDPSFARQPFLQRGLSAVRSALGLDLTTRALSPHDLAVNELMRQVVVTNDSRSYLITIAMTSENPEQAATLVNAIASEYLRSQMMQHLTDARAAAEGELAELSSVYGLRHPNYLQSRARLERLQTQLAALRSGSSPVDEIAPGMGQSLLAASKVIVPSGPNVKLILGATAGAALAAGIWLALRGHSGNFIRRSDDQHGDRFKKPQ
jgi:uncharacterized protein involved in exopolysaccharide biosynthesis